MENQYDAIERESAHIMIASGIRLAVAIAANILSSHELVEAQVEKRLVTLMRHTYSESWERHPYDCECAVYLAWLAFYAPVTFMTLRSIFTHTQAFWWARAIAIRGAKCVLGLEAHEVWA